MKEREEYISTFVIIKASSEGGVPNPIRPECGYELVSTAMTCIPRSQAEWRDDTELVIVWSWKWTGE